MILSPSFNMPFNVGGFSYPVETIPKTVSIPKSGGNNMSINWGGAASGAGSGAATGTAINPGIGTAIGGVIGGIAGLFTPKSSAQPTSGVTAGMPAPSGSPGSLLGALGTGLSSIPFFSKNEQTNVQTQSVNQDSNINLTNIIGNQPFGGVNTETGDFDIFKTMADVFAIRDAQNAAYYAGATGGGAAAAAEAEPMNIGKTLMYGGAALLAVLLLTGKGK